MFGSVAFRLGPAGFSFWSTNEGLLEARDTTWMQLSGWLESEPSVLRGLETDTGGVDGQWPGTLFLLGVYVSLPRFIRS